MLALCCTALDVDVDVGVVNTLAGGGPLIDALTVLADLRSGSHA
jgi:hypothetical protein